MTDQLERLKSALADRYAIEREIGSGGMATVYLARDIRHERDVAVKVLRPELAAALGPDRFLREIRIAANLHHPHILPLYDSGEADGFLYYVMPYEQGQSLRDKLAKEGELPIAEAVRILRDVVDALAHAHEQGVVHRDIKPDNVLLSGRHALVTDFGVAKAVSEATGRDKLTTAGVALGTPAYMAPEQATADEHIDHRADIYAVGALAYELLAGRPPFLGTTPQMVLAAHVTEDAEPVTKYRNTVPAALDQLVMKCLEKKAADRFQTAEDLLPHLEAVMTPSGGITPTGTQPAAAVDYRARAEQAHPIRVAGLFGLAAVGLLAIVYALVQAIGLPTWVFVGSIGLVAGGLPIVLLTGHHERRRALARATGVHVTTPIGLNRHFTWSKAFIGGAVAFAGLSILTAAFMASRILGIGPAATLVSSGTIGERSEVILVEFENNTPDSALGASLTTLFRVDLAQSRVIKLVAQSTVTSALRRMERNPGARVDSALAREIADREGIPVIIAGEISAVGSAYVLTSSVISSSNGEVLTAASESADNTEELIEAVGNLSLEIRERIGESLTAIRTAKPLARVTTGSLDALQLYSQAESAEDRGDFRRAAELLEQAVAIDTAFAMAYRKLGVIRGNTFESFELEIDATTKAFMYRDRLPDEERYLTEARYYGAVEGNREMELAAYRSVLTVNPDESTALNNLANELNGQRRFAEAEPYAVRAMETGEVRWTFYANVMAAQAGQGKWAEAESTLARFARDMGEDSPHVARFGGDLAAGQEDYATARRYYQSILDTREEPFWQFGASAGMSGVARMEGKLAEAETHVRRAMQTSREAGLGGNYLFFAFDLAELQLRLRDDPDAARQTMDEAFRILPLDSVPATDRPYSVLALFYAAAGDPGRARELLSEYEREVDERLRRSDWGVIGARAAIAEAEGRLEEAAVGYRQWHDAADAFCNVCALYRLGALYEQLNRPDSAISVYEEAITFQYDSPQYQDPDWRVPSMLRLAQLYEGRGDTDQAIEYYNRFVELWQDADPVLQPIVEDVRGRIAGLVGERR
jgi:tetratricopeptide (TPR) repeat protein